MFFIFEINVSLCFGNFTIEKHTFSVKTKILMILTCYALIVNVKLFIQEIQDYNKNSGVNLMIQDFQEH